jgi:glycosyltransferase involved in cell wall biosynthesis
MTESAIDVSVVVPTYRRSERVARLLTALEAQTLPHDRFEVVVVDDGSDDNTPAVLAEMAAQTSLNLRPLRIDVNNGPGPARNLGWRKARAPLVAFTDDDCVPEPGWLAAGLAALRRNDHLGVVQGLTRPPAGSNDPGPWAIFRHVTWESPWFEACNIFYRRAALEATAGFDEGLRWYGEDTAAGWAVLEAGWERDFATDAVVVHDLEERGLRWRVRHGWLERNLVALAFRHPDLRRDAFWRPWAFRADGVALVAAVAAGGLARRRPAVLLGLLPYLWLRRLPLHRPRLAAGLVLVDIAQISGHLAASVRHRGLVI